MQNIYELLMNTIKANDYRLDINKDVFTEAIINDVIDQKTELIKILLSNKELKKAFFSEIEGVLIFRPREIIEVLSTNESFANSRTSYEQSIGLIRKNDYIQSIDDVVLAFPFKDTTFVGTQSKDDQKNSENFLHNIINQNDITRLFEPKAFTNIKRYSKDKVEPNPTITMDDNLIIKGNNLIALHSLLDKYRGKVKLIYIDPPYNTGNDSFGYNDRFKHSTWLTFMKNRLEVAREFLRDDGVIFVSIDDNEQAYLKVLMDEVFGRENFVANFVWRKTDNQANIGSIARVKEYILAYSVNQNFTFNKMQLTDRAKKEYRYSDDKGNFRRAILLDKTRGRYYYEVKTPSGNTLTGPWMKKEDDLKKMIDNDLVYWATGGKEQPYGKIYLHNNKGQIPNDWLGIEYGTNQEGATEITKLFNERLFDFPKPTSLIKHFITIGANPNDIILDFHAGSGTTAQAVLDLNKEDGGNRKFILIEQMDYIQDITCKRVEKVIEKNGGGDFVYMELNKIKDFENTILYPDMEYLPYREIEDEMYKVPKEEIEANKKFYSGDDE